MSADNQPPGLPDIIDEAADTPGWLPAVGLVLLVLFGISFAVVGNDGASGSADLTGLAAAADGGVEEAAQPAVVQPAAAAKPAIKIIPTPRPAVNPALLKQKAIAQ